MPEKYGPQKHDHWPPYRTLAGTHVELALLSHDHVVDPAVTTSDGAPHELWYKSVPQPEDM